MRWYLVMYDIRDPKRWRKVYEAVRAYGTRVQYSVFRCRLNDRDREQLRWALSQVIEKEDSLLVIGICDPCIDRVQAMNDRESWPEVPPTFRIL